MTFNYFSSWHSLIFNQKFNHQSNLRVNPREVSMSKFRLRPKADSKVLKVTQRSILEETAKSERQCIVKAAMHGHTYIIDIDEINIAHSCEAFLTSNQALSQDSLQKSMRFIRTFVNLIIIYISKVTKLNYHRHSHSLQLNFKTPASRM